MTNREEYEKVKKEIHSSKAFACLLTMCAGFSVPTLYRRRDLGGWPNGKRGALSVGLIGHEISDNQRSTSYAGLYDQVFLMTVFQRQLL